MELKKPSSVIRQKITPEEMAVKLVRKNKILASLDEEDQESVQIDLIKTIRDALQIERDTTDKFIELAVNEVGVIAYYIYLLDKVKYMATEAFIENSKKKRDLLLVDMAKILGANVVESTIPVPYKIKEIV
jgi:hypothetical protein